MPLKNSKRFVGAIVEPIGMVFGHERGCRELTAWIFETQENKNPCARRFPVAVDSLIENQSTAQSP
jgi:hypothetical protein